MTCKAIDTAVKVGLLEPAIMLDGEGRELRGYRPTAEAKHWFGMVDAPPAQESAEQPR